MTRVKIASVIVLVALVGSAQAQQRPPLAPQPSAPQPPAATPQAPASTSPPPAATSPQPAAKGDIEPGAMAALERMGAYLRSLKAFQVEAVTTKEDVLTDGQKIQLAGVVNLVARMPDRLRIETTNDRHERLYLYNGKQFTVWARRMNYYATVPAPPTIAQLTNVLEDRYDLEVPLVDLFRWGTKGRTGSGIRAAMDVGPSQVGGTTCEHYAFRQDDVDWQVWIQKGDFPLPRKVVITTMTDPARPQSSAVYTWNLAPSVNEPAFTFDPPSDAKRIRLAEVSPPAGGGK
jgi:hypothetical protein